MADRTQKNQFDINGRVIFKGEPIYISAKMSKRLLVLEVYVDNKYKQEVPFEFVNDEMQKLNNVRKGDWVEVVFNLRGRKTIQGDGRARWWPTNGGIACTVIEQGHGG